MKKLLLILTLLLTSVLACENDACTDNSAFAFNMDQGVALRTITFQVPELKNGVENPEDGQTTTRRSYNNRVNAKFYNVEINSDIDLYDLTRPLTKMHNISLAYEDDVTFLQTGYQINALYVAVNLGDNFSFYHGAMPFKGGRFSEIKDPTINGGNGLAIINNQVYSSNFLSFHDTTEEGKYSLIAGKSEFNTKNHYNGLLTKNEGSSGIYLIANYENGKHFFEADYYAMKVNMHELEYAQLKIGGVGYIYDDSLDSGFTLYTNLGISIISEDVRGLMAQYGITSGPMISYFKNVKHAHVDNTSNEKGYAGLFGINYEFDALGKSFNIGAEEFVTRGGWVSANHGVAFLSDHSWYANRNAFESSIYAGCNITKNLRTSAKFVHTESQQVVNAFSISQNSDQSTAFNGDTFYRRFNKIEFLINYTF